MQVVVGGRGVVAGCRVEEEGRCLSEVFVARGREAE
jgi:hypothetical protein